MIVEVLVREVGEGRRRKPHAVQPVLVETVARRLDREMLDALAGERGEVLVKLDRIGGREAGLASQSRREDAERADARRFETERRPEMTHKVDGR